MARQYTETDVQEMTKAEGILRDAGFNLDLTSDAGRQNGERIVSLFDANPDIPITVENVIWLVNERRDLFNWLSAAQNEYNKIRAEDPARAQQLGQWFKNQKDLVTEGDDGLQNQSTLLQELRGHEIGLTTIFTAIQRVVNSGTSRYNLRRRPLVFVPPAPSRDPRSHATTDAKTHKPGVLFDRTEVNKSPADYVAEQRRAAAEADRVVNPEKYRDTTTPARQPDAWEQIAKSLLEKGIYHSQRDALQAQFDRASKGEVTWRQAASTMEELVRGFKRLISTAKF